MDTKQSQHHHMAHGEHAHHEQHATGMDRVAIAGMMQRNFGSGFGYRC